MAGFGQPAATSAPDQPAEIPPEHRAHFHPATHFVYEWTDYEFPCDDADCVLVGQGVSVPVRHGYATIRFENQLGATSLRFLRDGHPVRAPQHLEVISRKLTDLSGHVSFLRCLLADLYTRAARLPFTFSAQTSRSTDESIRPPSPLFIFHYLCQQAAALHSALSVVQAAPHRRLHSCALMVPLGQASEADVDVLLSIVQSPQEWRRAPGHPLARHLRGHAPERVWQRLPEETFDTPENRFALSFLRSLVQAGETLQGQPWWTSVTGERRALLRGLCTELRHATAHPMFEGVGPMRHFPSSSQVLMRREGYRELRQLWQLFHQARRPLFGPLQHAIELRDIATLYEFWAFFRLCEEIGQALDRQAVLNLKTTDEKGLRHSAAASFGHDRELVYNRTFGRRYSYSLPLRPDFTWLADGKPAVVFDAKFRLEWEQVQAAAEADEAALDAEERAEDARRAVPERTDLCKMHTYRDALGVRAAVAIYPGTASPFYDKHTRAEGTADLSGLLCSDREGIGALAMTPTD